MTHTLLRLKGRNHNKWIFDNERRRLSQSDMPFNCISMRSSTTDAFNNDDIMTYSHIENLRILSETPLIKDGFDYVEYDPYRVFEHYFQFCQTSLSENCTEYDIQPALIYITNNREINAEARRSLWGFSIVAVSFGTVVRLHRQFTENSTFFRDKAFEDYGKLESEAGKFLPHLMLQACLQFVYYHELGHLIQQSKLANPSNPEAMMRLHATTENYSIESHVYELDADLFASSKCAEHCLELWHSQNEVFRTTESLIRFAALWISSIMVFFVSLVESKITMYYQAGTHPHPLIRLSYIVDNFTTWLTHYTPDVSLPSGVNVQILTEALHIAEAQFKDQQNIQMDGLTDMYLENLENISAYINEILIQEAKSRPELVMTYK